MPHFIPQSLRARTSVLLIVGLCVTQAAGLTIHALDHVDFGRRNELRESQHQVFVAYRSVVELEPGAREAALKAFGFPSNFKVTLSENPDPLEPRRELPLMPQNMGGFPFMGPSGPPGQSDAGFDHHGPPPQIQSGRPPEDNAPTFGQSHPIGAMEPTSKPYAYTRAPLSFGFFGNSHERSAPFGDGMPPMMHAPMVPRRLMPQKILVGHQAGSWRYIYSLQFPDKSGWLVIQFKVNRPTPFDSPTFLIAFALMTICGGTMILWGTQRLIAPVGTLAHAAEALGRDVNAPALPERGPTEIRRAAIAFNDMAARIRRFVSDRTLMLTAIGHDLRTPITRLKLRAEFIEDDDLRDKFLADLDEMESMVAATLAFGRDTSRQEPMVNVELNALIQTLADEVAESFPQFADSIVFEPAPAAVKIRARPLGLKRAITNLVVNAVKYGDSAQIVLTPPAAHRGQRERFAVVTVEDHGPGLPEDELERMFEPFVRAEESRNRETGGSGLGLAIARGIIREQGGDVRLENRPKLGLRAVVKLLA
ncbi:ATP-binding protein [Brytella acorum]|uniref:histidine kinase n=1 Tax=Brytella acorum TaxID=2959299 RepID=A0AA35V5T4_9PROT|nr:ATP-binding protein [Brytella acorum]MDF3625433.1 ATP-binding protein [Brytella acorum]CAI9120284.1 ATP-binding protein [Brytella acorum]